MRVVVLIANIPERKRSCERLLAELVNQSRVPDGVVLVLDGYGAEPAPTCPLPIDLECRTDKCLGAGNRWIVASALPPEDVVVCLDDDVTLVEAPNLVQQLVNAVFISGGAAAAMGASADGKQAPPGVYSRGDLIYGAGCGLAMRAGLLAGLGYFAKGLRSQGGPDALGPLGDDDALVSAYLWKLGVKIAHATTGNIYAVHGTRSSSQTEAKLKRGMQLHTQKRAIKKLVGWPWKESPFDRT